MRSLPLLLLLTGCIEGTSPEASDKAVRLARGSGVEVAVVPDGSPVERLDWFDLAVDDPAVATAALTNRHTHVRITGKGEGETVVRIRYGASELQVATQVDPPAILHLSIEPSGVTTPLGAMVPIRATALDTTSSLVDVTAMVTWTLDDPSIARVEGDRVRGMAPGQTVLRANVDGVTTAAALAVTAD